MNALKQVIMLRGDVFASIALYNVVLRPMLLLVAPAIALQLIPQPCLVVVALYEREFLDPVLSILFHFDWLHQLLRFVSRSFSMENKVWTHCCL